MDIKVAIVEDDVEIRNTLAHRIASNRGFKLVESYGDAESALIGLPLCRVDVVLMDINLPHMDGVECVRRLKQLMRDTQFMMLTVYDDANRLFKSLMAGASGYLLKRTPPGKLLEAIREVYDGGSPMTPEIARRVVQRFQTVPAGDVAPEEALTPREHEILNQLSKGYRYKEIVENLDISTGTLNSHIRHIYDKLHVHSRLEAVMKFMNR
jgi:DNA-binding NarL/FixJ family response regulator